MRIFFVYLFATQHLILSFAASGNAAPPSMIGNSAKTYGMRANSLRKLGHTGRFHEAGDMHGSTMKDAIIGAVNNAFKSISMAHMILAETTASVSELKKDPMGTVSAGEGFPVAILNRNQPVFYCVPAKAYEALMNKLEDMELNAVADARKGQAVVKVRLDEL